VGHHPYWNESLRRDKLISAARRAAGDRKRAEIARGNRQRLYGEYLALGEDVRREATVGAMAGMLGTSAKRLLLAIQESEENVQDTDSG
jgi:hypothetical protein